VEEWESDSAIDIHFITPHMQNVFLKAVPLLAKEPDIRRYLVISSAES
jgi:quinol monooxygenase YgiN